MDPLKNLEIKLDCLTERVRILSDEINHIHDHLNQLTPLVRLALEPEVDGVKDVGMPLQPWCGSPLDM